MKYYVIAGEASGDLHGSNLISAIGRIEEAAEFRAWGGDLMAAAGADVVRHYRTLAFMGFSEVVKNLPTILQNISFCKADILYYQPDVLILVDYPGFNLRIAAWAKTQNIRVFYYISPQLWAWHRRRVYAVKRDVEAMFVILPFEQDFYKKYNYPVYFVGHPLLDVVHNYQNKDNFVIKNNKPIIALLPGSRRQEISRILPVMLSVVGEQFADYQFIVGVAPAIPLSFYQQIAAQHSPATEVDFEVGRTYDLLSNAYAALVTSGTATLETALFKVPQVVCYRGSRLSYFIAKRLVSVRFISLVNLIADRLIVTELIQNQLNTKNLSAALRHILQKEVREKMQTDYYFLCQQLGEAGASERAAQQMVQLLEQPKT